MCNKFVYVCGGGEGRYSWWASIGDEYGHVYIPNRHALCSGVTAGMHGVWGMGYILAVEIHTTVQ